MKKHSILKLFSIVMAVVLALGVMMIATACPPQEDEVKEYTITYDLNDRDDTAKPAANNPDNPTKYTAEDLPLEINAPTREGYLFLGWTSERHKNNTLKPKLTTSTAQNLTFTAHWELNKDPDDDEFRIRLYSNMDSATFTVGGKATSAGAGHIYTVDDLSITITAAATTNRKFVAWVDGNGNTVGTNLSLTIDSTIHTSLYPDEEVSEATLTANWEEESATYGNDKLKAPDFTLYKVNANGSVSSESISLSDYYGEKAVFITFWQYSCTYCLGEMKDVFKPLYGSISDEVEILAVHSKDMAGLKTLLGKNSYNFPILDDNKYDAINKGYYTGAYPSNYMVDRWGYLYSATLGKDADITQYNYSTIHSESEMTAIINGAKRRAEL